MKSQYLKRKKLPDSPGIYIFRDYRKRPIYIGRATSLKDRVRSYFGLDLIEARGPRIVDMVTKSVSLTWQETASVLEAIILEGILIKKYQPFYNVDERDDKSAQYVVITDEAWPRVFLARARDFEQSEKDGNTPYPVKRYFGPYTESGLIKDALKILRKLFPFRDKKAHDPRHESFYRIIGKSPETIGDGAHEKYLRTIKYLILFFEGKRKKIRTLLERQMKLDAKKMLFEEAAKNRKLLYALEHINDIALIKRNSNSANSDNGAAVGGSYRTEAYDIAHLSGTNVVGAMTVSVNGLAAPNEYRKFKIKIDANNDVAGLTEMLFRRLNHTEWAFPDLIVVDGNQIQRNAAENVLKSRRVDIPVVAVTKNERHKAADIIGLPELVSRYRHEIIAVNAEAHRFAIAYHRRRRNKSLL
jgi:excinuclease ABC subunit C